MPPAAGVPWTGDADRGTDWRQPGGWIYNVLPYIEQQRCTRSAGLAAADGRLAEVQRATPRIAIPLDILYCPTRRPAIAYPYYSRSSG